MIDRDYISQEIDELLSIIDAEEMPETYELLSDLANGYDDMPFYEIANGLLYCDKSENLPDHLISFIVRLFELEIENGNADAMNDLGAQYYNGTRGFEQNYEKAVYYYNMAAENGSAVAQENLGYCYYYGRIGEPDYEKAFHYFSLGAFLGNPISLYKIGDMYYNGYFVKKNEKEAFHIYVNCLDNMTEEAEGVVSGPLHLRLGRMFLNGCGVEKDPKSALICFQKAESFLYDMVKNGEKMYKKSLLAAIEGQTKARKMLSNDLPK